MKVVTFDAETYYDREYSLSKITTEEYVRSPLFEMIGFAIKIDDGPTQWVPQPETEAFLKSFDWSDAMVVCQNTAFDGAILNWRYGVNPMVWADTLGMSRALFPHEKSHSLDAQTKRLGIGIKGDEVHNAIGMHYKDFSAEQLARYAQYCELDVFLTYQLFLAYMGRGFPKSELKLIDLTLRMFIDPVLELDRHTLEAHYIDVVDRKEKLLYDVRGMLSAESEDEKDAWGTTPEDLKKLLMSNEKFATLLRSVGVEPPTKVSATTGKIAWAFAKTDEAFKALEDHPDERVQALVAARLGNKTTLEETRTQRFIGMADRGKFPVPLRYYGAHSGRWSGQDSVNLQNLPSRGTNAGKIKKAIKAPPGYVVIDCDSAQIEARTLAWLAGQDDLVQAFKDKQDVYKLMATKIYGISIGDVDKTQRQVGKTVVLGCFGPNTPVLTNRGWVPIVQVQATDTVWDGEEWVCHQGVVPQGEKEVLTALGISATSDHEILTEHGWVEWSEVLANLSLLKPAMSLANSLALAGSAVLMDPSGKASSTISPRCAAPADGKVLLSELIFGADEQRGATTAQRKNQPLLGWLHSALKRCAQMLRTASACSPALAPSSAGAPTPTTLPTQTTAGAASRYTLCGYRTALRFCATLLDSTAGMCPHYNSTAATTTEGTNRATYGSSPEAKTCRTNARSKRVTWKGSSWSCDALKQRMQTYDIAYAGPRNCYTILTSEGPLIVHNCGYGVGHKKLQAFLKTQAGVEVTLEEAKRIIDTYRSSANKIADLWAKSGKALEALMLGQETTIDAVGIIKVVPGVGLTLPSGLHIQYPNLRVHTDAEGKRELIYDSKGLPVRIYGGKVVENVCQAVARQIVAEQMLRVSKRYKVVLTVHDAVAIIAPETEAKEAQAYLEECMSWNPKWATGLPLSCESGMGASYGDC
jgi:hypothetical protein